MYELSRLYPAISGVMPTHGWDLPLGVTADGVMYAGPASQLPAPPVRLGHPARPGARLSCQPHPVAPLSGPSWPRGRLFRVHPGLRFEPPEAALPAAPSCATIWDNMARGGHLDPCLRVVGDAPEGEPAVRIDRRTVSERALHAIHGGDRCQTELSAGTASGATVSGARSRVSVPVTCRSAAVGTGAGGSIGGLADRPRPSDILNVIVITSSRRSCVCRGGLNVFRNLIPPPECVECFASLQRVS